MTKAQVIFHNTQIITMNPLAPQAEALAISQGQILAIGTKEEVLATKGPQTKMVDLQKQVMIPGLIESHGHLMGMGRLKQIVNLTGVDSLEEIQKKVAQRAQQLGPKDWVVGRGWDHHLFLKGEFPHHRFLTQASPNLPVYVTRIDGHGAWVNQKALELAGLNRHTPNPQGGKLLRDAKGNLTGVLIDTAMELVEKIIPPESLDLKRRALKSALEECYEKGVTGFHDAWSPASSIPLYEEFLAKEELDLRLYVMLAGNDPELLQKHFTQGPRVSPRLTIRAVKLYADGALGSCGAALFSPYEEDKNNCGLLLLSEDEVYEMACQGLQYGFQICTHAIGDRANHLVLNAYERALKHYPQRPDHRFRVEHAQLLARADLPRFAQLGVIASMQASHCTSDMNWIDHKIGQERARDEGYLWRDLLDSGAIIANGSDVPIEVIDPLWGIYSSVARKDRHGHPPGGWNAHECMTRWEALRSFTLHGAFASFEEKQKGSLEVGKYSDFVVLSKNPLEIKEDSELLETKVLMTHIGEKTVYTAF